MLWELERDGCRLEAARTRLVGEWAGRFLFRDDGSRAAGARLARETGCTKEAADAVVRRAKKLQSMPLTQAAFDWGELSVEKVDALCLANGQKRQGAFADAEARLLSDAKRLGAEDFKGVLAAWRDAADVAGSNERAQRDLTDSYFSTGRTSGDCVVVSARIDPVRGSLFEAELDRLAQDLFDREWAALRAELGELATVDQLGRTAGERRAEAASIMAQRSRAMAPGSTFVRPLFTVLIDEDTARRVCELSNGKPVAPGHLASFIAEADFERVVFGPKGRVLDVGRRSRFFRGGLRRAIEVRDRRCTFPGCREPAERCDVDHIVEWSDGGETTQDNGRLRCGPHNRQRPGRSDLAGSSPSGQPPLSDQDDEYEPPDPDPPDPTDVEPPGLDPETRPPRRDRPGTDPPAHGPPA